MKKVNFKSILMTLVVAFTILFLGVEKATAQSGGELTSGLYSTPQGNFLDPGLALSEIENILTVIKGQLANLIPGTALYKATERQYRYFSAIHENLQDGISVPVSIIEALNIFLDAEGLSIKQLAGLKQDAIDLLSI